MLNGITNFLYGGHFTSFRLGPFSKTCSDPMSAFTISYLVVRRGSFQAQLNQTNGILVIQTQLTGSDTFSDTSSQLNFDALTTEQVTKVCMRAWDKLCAPGQAPVSCTTVKQGHSELYPELLAKLQDAVEKSVSDEHTQGILLRMLAFENVHHECKMAMCSVQQPTLPDHEVFPAYIKACEGIGSDIHKAILWAWDMKDNNKTSPTNSFLGACYNCGQLGHTPKNCTVKNLKEAKQAQQRWPNAAAAVCPCCRKGKHWANNCHSKYDIDGNPLPQHQGNGEWGQSQALTQNGMLQTHTNVVFPLQAVSSQPLAQTNLPTPNSNGSQALLLSQYNACPPPREGAGWLISVVLVL